MRFDIDGGGGFDGGGYYELPYNPSPSGQAITQGAPTYADPAPIQDAFYGLPVGPSPVSRVGPTVSVAPRAALDPNMRSGSLFSGGFPTQANYRAGRGVAFQRGFTVEMQDRLQRRRRKKFWEL
jgi:hypothetical protein